MAAYPLSDDAMNRSERHALLATVMVPVIMVAVWAQAPLWFAMVLLVGCPVVLLHLVWCVLHDTSGPVDDLPPGHEWDYLDRPDLADR